MKKTVGIVAKTARKTREALEANRKEEQEFLDRINTGKPIFHPIGDEWQDKERVAEYKAECRDIYRNWVLDTVCPSRRCPRCDSFKENANQFVFSKGKDKHTPTVLCKGCFQVSGIREKTTTQVPILSKGIERHEAEIKRNERLRREFNRGTSRFNTIDEVEAHIVHLKKKTKHLVAYGKVKNPLEKNPEKNPPKFSYKKVVTFLPRIRPIKKLGLSAATMYLHTLGDRLDIDEARKLITLLKVRTETTMSEYESGWADPEDLALYQGELSLDLIKHLVQKLTQGGVCPSCNKPILMPHRWVFNLAQTKAVCRDCFSSDHPANPDHIPVNIFTDKTVTYHINCTELTKYRKSMGLSLVRFAEYCGWSKSKQSRLETGDRFTIDAAGADILLGIPQRLPMFRKPQE